MHEDNEDQHRPTENKIGGRHDRGKMLEQRQLRDIRRASFEGSRNLLERVRGRGGRRCGVQHRMEIAHGEKYRSRSAFAIGFTMRWYARQDSNLLPPA
jgi:hypothetical protein